MKVNMDKQDRMLAEQAESVLGELLESAIADVASEAHRAAHLGMDPRLDIDEEEEYQLSVKARASVGDSSVSGSKKSKHRVDMFGQIHPSVATEVFECMNCHRTIMAGRFAPHLEKCMGKGRRARVKTLNPMKSELQEKPQTSRRGFAMTASLEDNGSNVNGGGASDEVGAKVSRKLSMQMQKEASKRLSRSSARRS